MTIPEPAPTQEEVPRLLFVAGEGEAQRVLEQLRGTGLKVSAERVATPEALRTALEKPWDLVVCGAELAGLGFREAAPLLREQAPALAFIVLTPRWDEAELREALRAGSHGYLDMGRLAQVELEIRREVLAALEGRQHQRAREQHQRRSEFVADLNHEIRSPLNAILGYCDLVMREEGSRLTPHGRRDLEMIRKSALTLLTLINDILELFRLEAGRMEVVPELVNLREMAQDCTDTVRKYLEGKDVALTTQLDERVLLVRADELKLREVLCHLLSHAALSTESGEISLTARAEGTEAIFLVEDTGAGIPADQLPFVFEKFHAPGAGTRKAAATALGLPLVKELTRLMGGSVSVQSTLGRGTCFTVRLPCLVEDEG